jgi:hypothetical protein
MTEAEWLACESPGLMFDHLYRLETGWARRWLDRLLDRLEARPWRSCPRKAVLLACAFCRLYWDNLGGALQEAVEVSEQLADRRKLDRTESRALRGAISLAGHLFSWDNEAYARALDYRFEPQVTVYRTALDTKYRVYAQLIREIHGNPFRPTTIDPAWLTSTVVELARGIYDERAFDRLPILADALQDAGCDDADVLDHCRGPGPHVRGCWVIDVLLGQS